MTPSTTAATAPKTPEASTNYCGSKSPAAKTTTVVAKPSTPTAKPATTAGKK